MFASCVASDSDGEPGALGDPLECRGFEDDDHVASFSNYALLPVDPPRLSVQLDFLNRTIVDPNWFLSPLLQNTANHSVTIEQHIVSAPGVCIPSTVRGGVFGYFSGTSQACPHVSGVVALAYGSADTPGPCTDLPPLHCMRLIVDRALERERVAGMAFEFFPWTTPRATRKGLSNTDFVLVKPHSRDHPSQMYRASSDGDSGGGDRDGEGAVGSQEEEAADSQMLIERPMLRMRKYFGPIVLA